MHYKDPQVRARESTVRALLRIGVGNFAFPSNTNRRFAADVESTGIRQLTTQLRSGHSVDIITHGRRLTVRP
jgi:hypothetical protein